MTRFRLVFVSLALILAIVAVRLVWTATHKDDRDSGNTAARTAVHGAVWLRRSDCRMRRSSQRRRSPETFPRQHPVSTC